MPREKQTTIYATANFRHDGEIVEVGSDIKVGELTAQRIVNTKRASYEKEDAEEALALAKEEAARVKKLNELKIAQSAAAANVAAGFNEPPERKKADK